MLPACCHGAGPACREPPSTRTGTCPKGTCEARAVHKSVHLNGAFWTAGCTDGRNQTRTESLL